MKKISILILLICSTHFLLLSQDNPTQKTKIEEATSIQASWLPKINILNIDYLTIEALPLGSNDYEFKISNTKTPSSFSFITRPLTYEAFYSAFKYNFRNLIDTISDDSRIADYKDNTKFDKSTNLTSSLKKINTGGQTTELNFEAEAKQIFNYFIASIRTAQYLSNEPEAGKLCYTSTIDITLTNFNTNDLKAKVNAIYDSLRVDYIADKKTKNKHTFEYNNRIYIGKKEIKAALRQECLDEEENNRKADLKKYQNELSDSINVKDNFKKLEKVAQENLSNSQIKLQALVDSLKNKKDSLQFTKIAIDALDSEFKSSDFYSILNIKNSNSLTEDIFDDTISVLEKKIILKEAIQKQNQIDIEKNNLVDKDEILSCNKIIVTEQAKVSEITQNLDELNTSYTLLQEDVEFELTADATEKAKRQTKISKLKGERTKLNTEISNSKLNIVQQELKIKTLNLKISNQENIIEQSRREVNTNNSDLILLKYFKEITILYLSLKNEKEKNYSRSIKSLTRLIKSLKGQIDNDNKDLEKLKLKIANYETQIKLIEKKIKNAQNKLVNQKFKIDYTEIEFNDGYIENIEVYGKIIDKNGKPISREIRLENLSPIGFSRKVDYNYLKNEELHSRSETADEPSYKIQLKDFLTLYRPKLEVDRRDYSPANQIKILKKDDCYELKKVPTYKLFEINAFSDFAGIGTDEPNGLVQLEFEKRIPIITDRISIKLPRKHKKGRYEINIAFLQYIEPSLTISKFEENERYLGLERRDKIVNGIYKPTLFQSSNNLLQYQVFSTGFNFNFIQLDLPTFKSTFYLDPGFRYGVTPTRDTVYTLNQQGVVTKSNNFNENSTNTLETFFRLSWEIKAEERFQFIVSYQPTWFFARTNRFQQVQNIEDYAFDESGSDYKKPIHRVELLGYYNPPATGNGRIFIRYRWNWQHGYWNTGFRQLQIGYSFYLLGRK